MSQRHTHKSLAKCIKSLIIEQERNTWMLDTLYTSWTLTRKGKRLLRKWHKLYTKEWAKPEKKSPYPAPKTKYIKV